jgi:hypothetical protein
MEKGFNYGLGNDVDHDAQLPIPIELEEDGVERFAERSNRPPGCRQDHRNERALG